MKPMLAKLFDPRRMTYPCLAQAKLDGIRGISLPTHPTLQSRPKPPEWKQIFWNPGVLPHIDSAITELRKLFPHLIFDGELYNHHLTLQQINSRVAVKRTSPHQSVGEIAYHIFDYFDPTEPDLTATTRADFLATLAMGLSIPHLTFIDSIYCANETTATRIFHLHLRENYEGTIYRKSTAPYTTPLTCKNKELRDWRMQKRKLTQDLDCTIIGLEPGEPGKRHADVLGAFLVQSPTGQTFTVGNGYTDEERATYWSLGPACLGGTIRVTFRKLSDSFIPLEPRAASVTI